MENTSNPKAQKHMANPKLQGTKRVSMGLTDKEIKEHKKHREQQLGHKIVPPWENTKQKVAKKDYEWKV